MPIDCKEAKEDADDDEEEGEDSKMEDLTEEAKDDDQEKDGPSNESEEEEEEDEDDNSCIQVYFQLKDQSKEEWFHQSCCLLVLEAILDEKMFDQLRTKETLGYYVSATANDTRGVQGMNFCVQSSEYSPTVLEERILRFIKE